MSDKVTNQLLLEHLEAIQSKLSAMLVFDSGKIKSIVNQQVNRRRKSLSLHVDA